MHVLVKILHSYSSNVGPYYARKLLIHILFLIEYIDMLTLSTIARQNSSIYTIAKL